MADIEDVRDTIAGMISAATHPNGVSFIGTTIAVYPGYPNGVELDAAMLRGDVQVQVNPLPNMTTFLPTPLSGMQDGPIVTQTLKATIAGQTVTFTGVPLPGSVVQVAVNGVSYPYVVLAADTLATIAAGQARIIPGASSASAVLSVPSGKLGVVLTSLASTSQIVSRERSVFAVDVIAPTPALRAKVSAIVHASLAGVIHFTTPDGTPCTLAPGGGSFNDMPQRANVYVRTIRMTASYNVILTTQTNTVGAVLVPANLSNTVVNIGTAISVGAGF